MNVKKVFLWSFGLLFTLGILGCAAVAGLFYWASRDLPDLERLTGYEAPQATVILARDDVSEDAIYNFTKDLFDNAEAEISSHAKYGELNLDFAASVTSVPYHAGAAKYFAEKGYTVPTK